uniref:Globin family profile domain-containing protein n=1 Tax=Meloidogyne javanica TaxID=6303 RepID=A0A915LNX8_MELJA
MSDSKRLEIQSLCLESLSKIKIGTGPEEKQNGKDFYKYFFTNYPDLRVYFKGAEKYTADDVQKSERFEKQGQRILLAMHLTARVYADETTIHSRWYSTRTFKKPLTGIANLKWNRHFGWPFGQSGQVFWQQK